MDRSKFKILSRFLRVHENLPAQGSRGWLDGKKFTIGGSEMGILNKASHYGDEGSLIKFKSGIEKFPKNIWMLLGNVYEPVATTYQNLRLKTHIHETGSIPGLRDDDGEVIQSYSPDGIGVVKLSQLDQVIPEHYKNEQYNQWVKSQDKEAIVLFEFKCPGCRIPESKWCAKTNGYKAQVKTGLATIPITDIGLYVDSVIRQCSLNDLGFNPIYNCVSYQKRLDLGTPIMIGFIGVCDPEQPYTKPPQPQITRKMSDLIESYMNKPKKDVKWALDFKRGLEFLAHVEPSGDPEDEYAFEDFGACEQYELEDMLENVVDPCGCYKSHYSRLIPPGDPRAVQEAIEQELAAFYKYCKENDYCPAGILPWKLFDVKYIPVYREPEYVEQLREKIVATINAVKYLNSTPKEQRKKEFEKLFPPKKVRRRRRTPKFANLDDLFDAI